MAQIVFVVIVQPDRDSRRRDARRRSEAFLCLHAPALLVFGTTLRMFVVITSVSISVAVACVLVLSLSLSGGTFSQQLPAAAATGLSKLHGSHSMGSIPTALMPPRSGDGDTPFLERASVVVVCLCPIDAFNWRGFVLLRCDLFCCWRGIVVPYSFAFVAPFSK